MTISYSNLFSTLVYDVAIVGCYSKPSAYCYTSQRTIMAERAAVQKGGDYARSTIQTPKIPKTAQGKQLPLKLDSLTTLQAIQKTFNTANSTFTLPSALLTKRTNMVITRTPFTVASIPLPLSDAPLIPNPQPLNTPVPFAAGNLVATFNANGTGGPLYFRNLAADPTTKLAADTVGTRVLQFGIQDVFNPAGGGPGGPNKPLDSGVTTATIQSIGALNATFDLEVRWSSEPAYDFFTIKKGPSNIFSQASHGPDVNNPYLGVEIKDVTLAPGEPLTATFRKDPAYWAGVDACYIYLKNLVISNPITVPTKLTVTRASVVVYEFANVANLDKDDTILVVNDYAFQAGDVITLSFDGSSYSDVKVDFISTF